MPYLKGYKFIAILLNVLRGGCENIEMLETCNFLFFLSVQYLVNLLERIRKNILIFVHKILASVDPISGGVSATAIPASLRAVFFAAAVPTPMRAAAITFWVILFPENEGQMAAFGFVQHNFFILFNAVIGLVFWRRAQRELFS